MKNGNGLRRTLTLFALAVTILGALAAGVLWAAEAKAAAGQNTARIERLESRQETIEASLARIENRQFVIAQKLGITREELPD